MAAPERVREGTVEPRKANGLFAKGRGRGPLEIMGEAPSIQGGMIFASPLAAFVLVGAASGAASAPTFGQGWLRHTGKPLDLALCGRGFFVLGEARRPSFTRSGGFVLDREGRLVSRAFGKPVLGWQGGALRPILLGAGAGGGPLELSVAPDGAVFGRRGDGPMEFLATIAVAAFRADPSPGPRPMGEFRATRRTGPGVPGEAGRRGLGMIQAGFLEGR